MTPSLSFKPNEQGDGHTDGILHDNVPQIFTEVHLGVANNIAMGCFQLFVEKN